MLPLYDAHAHLTDVRIFGSLQNDLEVCRQHGIRGIFSNGTREGDWKDVLTLQTIPECRIAIGVHPFFFSEWNDETAMTMDRLLLQNPRLQVGEIGLDAFSERLTIHRQMEVLSEQLTMAQRHGRIVSVHNRKSWNEFFDVLNTLGCSDVRGICHHFTGSRDIARKLLDVGFYLSFCGPVTYPQARRIHEAAQFAPSDRLLTETDCPDLPPFPLAPSERSLPWHVGHVLNALSQLRRCPLAAMAETVESNWHRLFDSVPSPP